MTENPSRLRAARNALRKRLTPTFDAASDTGLTTSSLTALAAASAFSMPVGNQMIGSVRNGSWDGGESVCFFNLGRWRTSASRSRSRFAGLRAGRKLRIPFDRREQPKQDSPAARVSPTLWLMSLRVTGVAYRVLRGAAMRREATAVRYIFYKYFLVDGR